MRIYKLTSSDCYAELDLKGYNGSGGIIFFPEVSLIDKWDPPEVEVYNVPSDNFSSSLWTSSPGDYTTVMGAPTFSQRAVNLLSDLLDGQGELLPLIFPGNCYYAYNTTRLVLVDGQKSEFDRSRRSNRICWIERPVFNARDLSDISIFKPIAANQDGSIYYTSDQRPLVTVSFVNRVRDSDLTGFSFEEIWSSDD